MALNHDFSFFVAISCRQFCQRRQAHCSAFPRNSAFPRSTPLNLWYTVPMTKRSIESLFKPVIHEEDGTFWAEVPAMPGCFTVADSLKKSHPNVSSKSREDDSLHSSQGAENVTYGNDWLAISHLNHIIIVFHTKNNDEVHAVIFHNFEKSINQDN